MTESGKRGERREQPSGAASEKKRIDESTRTEIRKRLDGDPTTHAPDPKPKPNK